ncbi:hypothetical protein DCC81_08070 [Chitinophaga parva]|uniref:FecR protein domain-containing protein n=1 Tax=Chitinophaga parva TaxID=2169414 RepID=A0A2T7BNZ9_9BACT|nr:FecR domain-containing protein [Chitinophaga parva]PUZ29392.1 hypothetical protein DCC81_08070 [Chitinophaga parva]
MDQQEKDRLKQLMEQYLQGAEHPEADARFEAWFREVKPENSLQLSREEVQQATDRVRGRLQAATAPALKRISRKRLYAISAAAAVLVMVGLSAFWNNNPMYNVLHPIKETIVYTRAGESKLLRMPDGSRIHLNENSILTYTNRFTTGHSREIALQGEAFFEVTKDADHPFIVRAGNAAVTVLGTSFNVSENKGDTAVMVAVKEGLIALQGVRTARLLLSAGKAALVPREGPLIEYTHANVDNFLSWMDGDLHFESTPLKEVVLELQQIYHANIRLENASLEDIHLTLQYKHAPLPAVLDVICNSLELQHVNVNGTIILQPLQP